jgi:hypothetical protein
LLTQPKLAGRSCADCAKYVYGDDGEVVRRPARTGLPVLRPKDSKPPCRGCAKIPEGAEPRPESAVTLSNRNLRAYQFYRECRAVGRWPDDAAVRHVAAVIRGVEEVVELSRAAALGGAFRGLFGGERGRH